eukprot:TRINITY_DN3247_c0_g1_i1.p1 TRINITY_DN3247_c0_g1~~TRINITY_DN3247_c0_g1_i1.p1  ORF type:complete len:180 (-),score=20.23 TRINITY_DN3247_c0_g1_i1:283-822(-)
MSIPGSAVDAWKVTGEINCSPEEALDQMWAWTESRWKRFNQNILLWEILFDSQGDLRICHQLDKLPWPLQPRDSLTVNIKKQTDKKTIILWCDNTEERSEWKCPSSCVRATVNFVAYIFEPVEDPRKSKLTHIVNLDPNGLLRVFSIFFSPELRFFWGNSIIHEWVVLRMTGREMLLRN